jgi:abhydrolase domain-containing protein 10
MSSLPAEVPFTLRSSAGLLRGFLHDTGSGPLGIFVHGFASSCDGTKSVALARHAAARGYSWLRFDLGAHGASDGAFRQFRLSAMLADLDSVLDHIAPRPVVLVGSSMGGWLAVLAALRRPAQIRGLLLIAPAFNFIQQHFGALPAAERAAWAAAGVRAFKSDYEDKQYELDYAVLEDAAALEIKGSLAFSCPLSIVHGEQDEAVPLAQSVDFLTRVSAPATRFHPVARGDHRLAQALPLLCQEVDALWQEAQAQ